MKWDQIKLHGEKKLNSVSESDVDFATGSDGFNSVK